MKKPPSELKDHELAQILMPNESAEVILCVDAGLLRELVLRFSVASEKAWQYDQLCK